MHKWRYCLEVVQLIASRILTMSCRAFSPRTVTEQEIFSLRRMANVRTVYRAFPNTGCWPVSCSSTCHRAGTPVRVWHVRSAMRSCGGSGKQRQCRPRRGAGNHLGGLLEAIPRLADADVEHQLGHADVSHGVGLLLLALRRAHPGASAST